MKTSHLPLFLFGWLVCVSTSGCDDDDTVVGSGNIVTETRDLDPFTAVSATSAIDLLILQGAQQEVVVRADDNIVALIETAVSDGALTVTHRRGTSFRNSTTSVELVLPDLEELELNSASDAVITDFVFAGPVTFDLNSASDLEITGSAPRANFQLNSACEVSGFGFDVVDCEVNLNSASDLDVTVTGQLSGAVRSASTLRYRGNPTIDVSVESASELVNSN